MTVEPGSRSRQDGARSRMHLDELLTAAVLLLGASAAAILLFQRAGFGSVLGLLVVGIVLGPHTTGPVVNIGPVAAAAELGVVFLLFVIGLELEPPRIWAMRRTLFGLGHAAGRCSPGWSLAAVGLAIGQPWSAALVLGFGLALSSTAFVLQLLAERDELAHRARPRRLGHPAAAGHGGDPAAGDGAAARAPGSSEPDAATIGRRALVDRRHARRDRRLRPSGAAARLRDHRAPAQCRGVRDPGRARRARRGLARAACRPVAGARRLHGRRAALGLAVPPPDRGRGHARSRACCWACSSSPSACRSISSLLVERWREIVGLVLALILLKGARDLRCCAACSASAMPRGAAHLAPADPGRRVRLRAVRRRRRHGRDGRAAADHGSAGHLAVDGGDAVPGPARRPACWATWPARRRSQTDPVDAGAAAACDRRRLWPGRARDRRDARGDRRSRSSCWSRTCAASRRARASAARCSTATAAIRASCAASPPTGRRPW